MDFLGIGFLIAVGIVGSIVFWALLNNSIILNPSLSGLFSWWLGCVVGTAVVLYLLFDLFFGAVSWGIDFVKLHYQGIIGTIIILGLLGKFAGRKDAAKDKAE